jgi:hypothetical protein
MLLQTAGEGAGFDVEQRHDAAFWKVAQKAGEVAASAVGQLLCFVAGGIKKAKNCGSAEAVNDTHDKLNRPTRIIFFIRNPFHPVEIINGNRS